MADSVHLVLIETSGNQAFIFATNRLRENVGASEIIHRIGTEFVLAAVKKQTEKPNPYQSEERGGDNKASTQPSPHPLTLANWLADNDKNPPVEGQDSGGVEVIVSTSGKALLLVKDKKVGKDIVADVTRRALEEAPGAVVRGFVSETFEFGEAERFDQAVKEVHLGIETLRAELPAPEARFAMLPVVAPCQTSGLPAERVFLFGRKLEDEVKEDAPPVDLCAAPVTAKRRMRKKGWKRIQSVVKERLADAPDKLDHMALDWRGVIHADGNGVGAIFLGFRKLLNANSARTYVDAYRKFSCSLELCTLAAFNAALKSAIEKNILNMKPVRLKKGTDDVLPVVPLILGGDDLTLVCDGEGAVDLASEFLEAFEVWSGKPDVDAFKAIDPKPFKSNIPEIAKAAFGVPRLGICAGVAVVKPHFPFHRAYQLSEALLGSAKTVKRAVTNGAAEPVPCSALDFHVHFDSSGADLTAIRQHLEAPGAYLTAKPYVVTSLSDLSGAAESGRTWASLRRWEETQEREGQGEKSEEITGLSVAANALLPKGEDDEARLARTQQHYLREGLFLGLEAADGRLSQIVHRYDKFPWKTFHPEKKTDSLFFIDDRENTERAKRDRKPVKLTWFLDALELAELRGRERRAEAEDDDTSQPAPTEAAS